MLTDTVIGGVEQRLWFRGLDAANPAVILLHGGPGTSEGSLFRHFNSDLEHNFLMVCTGSNEGRAGRIARQFHRSR